MGLRLRRTPLVLTQLLLGLGVVAALAGPPFVGLLASKIVAATGTPDISKIHFLHTSKYVRENSAGDIAAQLITYNATTDVNFYVDGGTTPIAGIDVGASGKNNHQWRLYAALMAGEHMVTATVQIDGTWYEVPGQATVYSLGMPDVSYTLPTARSTVFRPNDNPLRLKIDDTYNQFRDATFSLYKYDTAQKKYGVHVGSFKIKRAECDLREAGKYVLCDADKADSWVPLSDGETYAVKLATNTMAGNGVRAQMADYWTVFGVDGTAPVIDDFQIVGHTTVGDSIAVSATVADANIESVDFYVTRPQDDGVCDGSGEKIAEQRVGVSPDGFIATLDVSNRALASGVYCVSAIARDQAQNNSVPSSLSFTIDHTAPVATLRVSSSLTPSASTPVTIGGTVDGTASLALFRDGAKVDAFALEMVAAGQWSYRFDAGLDKGDHVLKVVATDNYGNSSTEVSSPDSFASVAVGAYVPPQEVRNLSSSLTPKPLSTPVAPAPSIVQIVASQHAQTVSKNDDGAILGAQTQNDPVTAALSTPIAPSSNGWTFFGIVWYWWTLLIVFLIGVGSWGAASIKRQRQLI